METRIPIQVSKLSDSGKDYLEDCKKLTPTERLACVQRLRVAFWGDEAATGRIQRIPELLKRKTG